MPSWILLTLPAMQTVSPLVLILGPTGSGKSSLAVLAAKGFAGEIVNCDSVQIYRYFDIGSAKVRPDERGGIAHHLIDICEPGELFTAGDYARRARQVVGEIAARGRFPIVTGGTGFYVRALLHGLFEGPPRDESLRARFLAAQARRTGLLHRLLRRLDPVAAARIHANDVNKTVRALEVIFTARRPMTEMFKTATPSLEGFRVLSVGLNPQREALYERLNDRTRRMFEGGLLDETRSILARGYPPSAKPFESLGYAQALRVVSGELSVDRAIEETQLATRRYAKRQWTWFRRERGMQWFDGFGTETELQSRVLASIGRFLQGC